MTAVLGIDIGGTKISLCAAGASGQVLARTRIATRSSDGASLVMERLSAAAVDLMRHIWRRHGVGSRRS
jgi:predicted NBD/HSP70 family sugar kinase